MSSLSSLRTVAIHVQRIRSKLGYRIRADDTRKAAELGLLEPASGDATRKP